MSRGGRRESVLGGKEQRGLEAAGGKQAPDIRERPRDISPAWRRSELCGDQSNGSHTASQQPSGDNKPAEGSVKSEITRPVVPGLSQNSMSKEALDLKSP